MDEETGGNGGDDAIGGRLALAGLLLVQFVIGYEWLASGLTKVVHGDFPGGLARALAERAPGTSGWYRSFLDGAVVPHAAAFGWLIEVGELLTGVGLIAGALAWLLAWRRLPGGGRVAVLVVSAVAAFAGFAMNVNFHLADGSAQSLLISGDSFGEAVDLDSVMAAIELLLLAVSIGVLASLHRGRRRTTAASRRQTKPPARGAAVTAVPERRWFL